MLESASQAIAGDFAASQELWNTPSQVCSIAACGWALYGGCSCMVYAYRNSIYIDLSGVVR